MSDLPEVFITSEGAICSPRGPETLTHLLTQLESELRKIGYPIDEAYGVGVAPEEVARLIESVGLTPVDEVVTFFGWRNGCRADIPMTDNFSGHLGAWFTLEEAIAIYPIDVRPKRDLLADEDIYSDWGNGVGFLPYRFPVPYSWAIECVTNLRPPRIHRGEPEFLDTPAPFFRVTSLCTLATWWLTCARNGAYFKNAEGIWDVNSNLVPVSMKATRFGY